MQQAATFRAPSWRDFGLAEILVDAMMIVILPAIALTPEHEYVGPLEPIRQLGLTIFGSVDALKQVLFWAWIAHTAEAVYAVRCPEAFALLSAFDPSSGTDQRLCSSCGQQPCTTHRAGSWPQPCGLWAEVLALLGRLWLRCMDTFR